MDDRAALMQLFRDRALKFGDFTLASGRKAKYYLDGKQITLHGQGLALVSRGLLGLVSDLEFDCVGGMSIGADPIVGGMLVHAAAGSPAGAGRTLEGFMVRKEAKGHGTKRYVEGPVQAGRRAVIIEDVVTTGGSALQAVDRALEFGLSVVAVVGIVDRLEGGAAAFAQRGLLFRSLLSIRDFGLEPPADGT